MHITRSLTVSADPAAVFEWIEDPQLASQWQPDVAEYAITKASPDVVGTEFRETLRSATGSKEMHGRITAYEPNTRMEFHIVGSGIRVRISYLITAAPPGTRLDVDADIHLGAVSYTHLTLPTTPYV